ncbi:peptide deformylase [Candidatus Saccharibacteria bacterium]|jgi:peptide deformylase|nr:peptide deformylase [Candidatus Saccharibacteria bacterium]MBP9489718.1 peptide deformylase [Candidatus Saccharibacteria bacterium]MBP9551983.1 peptide deformylase [Candidatus Saccharibacteria bacterium]
MKKEDIITLPNNHLRQKAERVHVITDEVQDVVKEMIEASLDWEKSHPHEISAALAAPQIDKMYKIIIVRSDLDDKNNQEFTALINPKVVKFEGDIVTDFEGCLSITSIYGKVPRYEKVRVKALDIHGNEVRIKAEGFLARVLQHEIDHTNGILFVDHIRDDKDAFYTLDDDGELQPLDYDKDIKDNETLWDDL